MRKLLIVSGYTFKEIYKSKVLLNTAFLGLCLVVVSFVASEFTYGNPQKVALDFGLGCLSISSIGIAIFMGVSLMAKEIESRTVYMILSRPISRIQFLVGRITGLSLILFLNILILFVMTTGFYWLMGGKFETIIFFTLIYAFLESLIILLTIVFFSLVTNSTMAAIYTIIIYILGHAIGDTKNLTQLENIPLLETLLKIYEFVFPNLAKLNIKDYITYQQSLSGEYLFATLSYGIIYSLALLFLISIIFNRKQLD